MPIISLETQMQKQACDIINHLFLQATEQRSTRAKNILKKCYETDWQTIKKRFNTDGSIWYVWYIDGVNSFIINHFNQ